MHPNASVLHSYHSYLSAGYYTPELLRWEHFTVVETCYNLAQCNVVLALLWCKKKNLFLFKLLIFYAAETIYHRLWAATHSKMPQLVSKERDTEAHFHLFSYSLYVTEMFQHFRDEVTEIKTWNIYHYISFNFTCTVLWSFVLFV